MSSTHLIFFMQQQYCNRMLHVVGQGKLTVCLDCQQCQGNWDHLHSNKQFLLSYDVASESVIKPFIENDNELVD